MLIKIVGNKTNFIDSNDNYVGYDTENICCCENPYWEILDANEDSFGINEDPGMPLHFTGEIIKGDDVVFPCFNGFKLRLVNVQNGYYSHMWDSDINGERNSGYI